MRRVATLFSATFLLFGFFSGCGGGGDQERTAGAAQNVLEDYFKAFADGDADACDFETDSFQDQANTAFAEIGETEENSLGGESISCPSRIKQSKAFLEAFEIDLDDATFEADEEASTDDRVVIDVTYPDETSETYTLVYDDGRWLVDDDGSTDSSDGDEGADGEMTDEEAAEQGAAWIEAWCEVKVGQTRDQAIAIMGEPTDEFTAADDAEPQIGWGLGPYDFTAFLDTDGIVRSLSADYDSLGSSDLAKMPCVEEEDGYLDRTDD